MAAARSYLVAALVVALFAAIGLAARPFLAEADLAMLMLLAVVIAASRASLAPALVAVALSVAAFDFLFVPPFYTMDIAHTKYLVTFGVLALVGATISSLSARVRERERAVAEEQARSALLSSVSHDLRTPLGSIIGSASALRQGGLEDHHRSELVDTIQEEAEHLMRQLEGLLQMTRIAGGAPAVHQEWQVPEEIVGAALRQLHARLGDRDVRVRIASELGLARFDGMLVELALSNLLDNSIKHTPDGTPVEVAVRLHDRDLVWEVSDEGGGLAPGDERRVFDKFYRGAGHRERGSGLGLAIVKAVAEAHGGRVWARNREGGRGAVIGFALPQRAEAPAAPAEEQA